MVVVNMMLCYRQIRFLLIFMAGPLLISQHTSCQNADSDSEYVEARERMIRQHLAARDITDERVLEAFRKVAREKFVPENLRLYAYADHALPIGHGQTISQPYVVALMTQLADVGPDSKVLEIGTGSGYQAAILSVLVDHVYSIEIIDSLAATAADRLDRLGYDNVTVRTGDGYRGWPEYAPFDAILVTAAPTKIPQPLVDQLSDSGRMVIPVGDNRQELHLVKKIGDSVVTESVTPIRFVPMTGEVEGQE
jgi:protein-L-isoaspartate(D-aspartate) O-methyltransferase